MYKLCVFDLDGTLVNSLKDLAVAVNYALRKASMPEHREEDFRWMVGNGIPKLIARAVPLGTPKQEEENVYRDMTGYYAAHCMDFTRPYEGTEKLLEALSKLGIRSAVLSNKEDPFVKTLVNKLFQAAFMTVLGHTEQFPKKPAPDALLYILHQAEISREECLYIGDSDVDVQTAHAAGIACAGAAWGFRGAEELRQAGADKIFDSPDDLRRYLSGSL